jgi:hypothetical protein
MDELPIAFITENSRAFRSGQISFGIRKVAEWAYLRAAIPRRSDTPPAQI